MYPALKRLVDIAVSALGLLLFSPLLLIVAIVIRLGLGSPVLYRQPRAGLHGRRFVIVKFRTMLPETVGVAGATDQESRLTALGRFLRGASLDELPQLINVLRGEMSLIGPRPLLMEYLDLYSPEQARRHEIRPGITGWAQVNGRNAISWEDKFRLDVWYVDHVGLLVDLRILWMTALRVLRRDGISAEGHSSAPRFTGSGGAS